MAGSKSNYLENALLDYIFGGSASPVPGTGFIGLWTTTLSDTSTGATAGEVSASGYARATVVANDTNWNAAASGAVDNKIAISMGTAGADWGTVTHGAYLDANANGNILYWWDWTASKIIQNGDIVTISAGALDVSEA